MGKSLGIVSFVLLLISFVIPVLGNYLSLLAVLVVCGAAYQGERTWTFTVDVIAWVKMFLLSPTWHFMMFGGGYMRGVAQDLARSGAMDLGTEQMMTGNAHAMQGVNSGALLITVVILAAPLAIVWWRSQQPAPVTPDA